jgi:DNA-binding MarR family transcriptional regulator
MTKGSEDRVEGARMDTHHDCQGFTTARKLAHAFLQFHKAEWSPLSIAGCTPGEIRVLFCLRKNASSGLVEMRVSDISRLMRVTSPTITQMVKGLEAQHLVERRSDPSDRRVVYVRLTEHGNLVTVKATEDMGYSVRGLVAFLGEEKSEQLAELLSEVARYFQEKAGDAPRAPWNGDAEA